MTRNRIVTILALVYSLFMGSNAWAQLYVNGASIGIEQGVVVQVNTALENRGTLRHSGRLYVTDSLHNGDSLICSSSSANEIHLNGNWINDGDFLSGIGLVNMEGALQRISGSQVSGFYDLNCLGSGSKSLFQNIQILHRLNLSDRELRCNQFEALLMDENQAVLRTSGYASTGYNGRLGIRYQTGLNTFYELPLGYNNTLRPVYVRSTTAGEFMAAVIEGDPTAYNHNRSQLQDSICRVNDQFFHIVHNRNGSTKSFALDAGGLSPGFSKLAHWRGSWIKLPASQTLPVGSPNLGLNNFATGNAEVVSFAVERPYIDAGPDLSAEPGNTIQLSAQGYIPGPASIRWTPGTMLSCTNCPDPVLSPDNPGLYHITIDNGPGCRATDSVRVLMNRSQVYIPNAFTPNGDGTNEQFGPSLYGNETLIVLEIFNRWGQKLHSSDRPWDGKFQGKIVPPGVYTYLYRVRRETGNGLLTYIKGKGTVMVLR